jgi:hypothetical protein
MAIHDERHGIIWTISVRRYFINQTLLIQVRPFLTAKQTSILANSIWDSPISEAMGINDLSKNWDDRTATAIEGASSRTSPEMR